MRLIKTYLNKWLFEKVVPIEKLSLYLLAGNIRRTSFNR